MSNTVVDFQKAFERLNGFGEEDLPEITLEASLFFDLLRDACGFDKRSSQLQVRINEGQGKIDILLTPPATTERERHIIVEVKKYGKFSWGRSVEHDAIIQAAGYARDHPATWAKDEETRFCIVTDGRIWDYLAVRKRPKGSKLKSPFSVHLLAWFNRRQDDELAQLFLAQTRPESVLRFMSMLAAAHQGVDE